MRIVFTPALGETVHVSSGRSRKSTTQLHFTATILDSTDYEQVASGRVKLQVWSDIGRNGEWGEAEFKPIPTPLALSEHALSLLPASNQPNAVENKLAIDFSVPLSDGQRFHFTYRILPVDPSGEIQWLGHYGQNGVLVLGAHDPLILGEEWTSDRESYRRNPDGRVHDLEVARLSHPSEYIAYPVAEHSFLYPKDSSLIVLVPDLSCDPVIVPPTLVFGATPSGSISLTPHGSITVSGAPALSLIVCESPEDTEVVVSGVINHCSSTRCRVVSYAPGVLVLASAADKYPVEVAIIPTTTWNPIIHSSLTLRSLASLISGRSPFFVSSLDHRNARFVPSEIGEESIPFAAGQLGGQFVLSSARAFTHGEEEWQVGIMSSSPTPSLSPEGLPTPPPSPRSRSLPLRQPPSSVSLRAASLDAQTPSGSSSQLVLHPKRRTGVLAVIGHLFMVLLTWITSLFGGPRVEVQPKRIANERTPLLQEPSYAQLPTTQDDAHHDPSNKKSRASGLSIEVGSSETTLLFQPEHTSTVFVVPIQLGGQNIDFDVQRLNNGIFVVHLSSTTGGSLTIG
ncbi:hypothetical protein DFH06DRAFT_1201733 [Mycena polygramma]|nr:hypothetical protein DFH06DRAFT_1201733 [Mycena polygramma]